MSVEDKHAPRYGEKEWFEQQYQRVDDDPWGLTWRPSQRVRYDKMVHCLWQAAKARDTGFNQVLDIGCALGDFTCLLPALLENGGQVTGVDVSEVAVQRAAERHPNIRFIQANLDDLVDDHAGRYDLVTCLEVLYYIEPEQRRATLQRLKALLKPRGMLLASSLLSKSHFLEREFVQLIGEELELVESDIVCMRMVNSVEKFILKLGKLSGGRLGSRRTASPGALSFKMASGLESVSKRFLASVAASHVYVLAKKS